MTRRAFTLIELLVTISIIGVLVSIGVITFIRGRKQATDARRISDMRNIETSLATYFERYRHYPYPATAGSEFTVFSSDSVPPSWIESEWSGEATHLFTPDFMRSVPVDPLNQSSQFVYFYTINRLTHDYKIAARTELTNKEAQQDNGVCDRWYEVFSPGAKNWSIPASLQTTCNDQ